MEIGSVAQSLKGHDKGRLYVVINLETDFAMVSDGAYRKMANLKRKRLSHLKNLVEKFPEEKIKNGAQDFEIKTFLKQLSRKKNS